MLIEKIEALKKSRIRVGAPTSNWASMIGHPCERKLVYERTCPEKKPVYDVSTQAVFDEGRLHERSIVQELLESGVEVFHGQKSFELKPYNIRGKLDFKTPVNGGLLIVEIKSITDHIFRYLNVPDDFNKYWWTVTIPGQLTCYMLAEGEKESLWILKNRGTGELKEIPYKLDNDFANELCKKAVRINDWVEMNDTSPSDNLPDKLNDVKFCDMCDFKAHCCPDLHYTGGVGLVDDKELEELLEKWQELRGPKKEYDKIDKDVKSRIKGCENALIGRFHVSGETVQRKGYDVKASEYWKSKIVVVD